MKVDAIILSVHNDGMGIQWSKGCAIESWEAITQKHVGENKKRTLELVHNMINNHNTLKVKVQARISYLFVQLWVYFAGCICRSPPLQTPERRCAEIFMRRSRCWPLGACLPGGGSDLSLVLNCPLAKNSPTCARTYSWGWEAVRTKPPGDAHMSAGIGGDGSRRILPP